MTPAAATQVQANTEHQGREGRVEEQQQAGERERKGEVGRRGMEEGGKRRVVVSGPSVAY